MEETKQRQQSEATLSAETTLEEEEHSPLTTEDDQIQKAPHHLVLVRGPLFDFCSATITIIISFAVVINYLVISDRVKLKDVPFVHKHEEPAFALDHQRIFSFPNAEISSHFDSGNARAVTQNAPYEFEVKVGGEPGLNIRRWFYFGVSNIQQPVTISFFVSNISLDYTILQNGLVPVFKSESSGEVWSRLEDVTRIRQVDANELEIEFSYQYDPASDGTIYFAMAYPWQYSNNQQFYRNLTAKHANHKSILFERHTITQTREGNKLDIILLSSNDHIDKSNRSKIQGVDIPRLDGDKKIFILTSRMHGYEVISSLSMRNCIKFLLSHDKKAVSLRRKFLFVIIPMMNPDGVKLGLNLANADGDDMDFVFPSATVNNSMECFKIKALITELALTNKLKGLLNIRSTLDQNVLRIGVPSISKDEIERHLMFPHYLSSSIKDYEKAKNIAVSSSNYLKEVSLLVKDGLVAEVNIPTMKRTKKNMGQVISTEIETVVNGVKAAQGGIGIRRISKKIMKALSRTLIPFTSSVRNTTSAADHGHPNSTDHTSHDKNTTTIVDSKPKKISKELRKKLEDLYTAVMQLNLGRK